MHEIQKEPDFLQSESEFNHHIRSLYDQLSSNSEKGKKFADLSRKLLSFRPDLSDFRSEINPKSSWDKGIDIFWIDSESNSQAAYCQSKLTISNVDELDLIISKFEDYEFQKAGDLKQDSKQLSLLNSDDYESPDSLLSLQDCRYFITTLSPLGRIIKSYTEKNRSSISFYRKLESSQRIEIVDLTSFYGLFREAYMKEFAIPSNIQFNTQGHLVKQNNVYVGIISAQDLIGIYDSSRQGIFFENVRSFLGLDVDINIEIFRTAREDPDKMLERNNGITFKANAIEEFEEDGFSRVSLKNAGIINGCQTTMCLHEAKPQGDCFLPIKIVIADREKSLEIAKTANTQNSIEKINLELSEYLRPQLVRLSLSELGIEISVNSSDSVESIANSISYEKIFYADLRYLFIGLFSRIPRNIFLSDYANIRFEDLKETYSSTDDKKKLVRIMCNLMRKADTLFENLKQKYPSDSNDSTPEARAGKIFNRFYTDRKGYKSYLIVFALCCMLGIDKESTYRTFPIKEMVDKMDKILDMRTEEFRKSLSRAFKAVAITVAHQFSSKEQQSKGKDSELEQQISQNLFKYLKSTKFETFYIAYGLLDS